MNEVISSHPKPVTIIATGCLTNIALLLTVYPEIKEKIEQLVFLGGAIGVGNMSPAAEFNMLIDPEAAKIVFESGLKKIVMIPIEVYI
jgi:inosine-uridine nucleoside N-ribohydrolase